MPIVFHTAPLIWAWTYFMQNFTLISVLAFFLTSEAAFQSTREVSKAASKHQSHILGQIVFQNFNVSFKRNYYWTSQLVEFTYCIFGLLGNTFSHIFCSLFRCFHGNVQNKMRELHNDSPFRRLVVFRQQIENSSISTFETKCILISLSDFYFWHYNDHNLTHFM